MASRKESFISILILASCSLGIVCGDDFKLLEAADAVNFYYNQLPYDMQAEAQDKRVIFTPKLGRAVEEGMGYDNVEYTPRLGRRKLPQDLPPLSEDDVYNYDQAANSKASYFSPRLGRNYNFSPRLGRELNYELYPRAPRFTRSVNATKLR
ncbi:unnamed protein product [Leptidea sinapis]|uniref:Pheromone biosynthesis activating neuropeptide n=1 Tax=Leptidea sinapis TaxID=189913 RepID=A0A5E4PZ28_9NEOP|nr:unnamed protein product [Leptidea sinapis]